LGCCASGGKKQWKKILGKVPHSPSAEEMTNSICLPEGTGIRTVPAAAEALPINRYSFENYTDSPNGPQIRIPVEKIPDISAKGQYQITWQSGSLLSNKLTFEWDGKSILVH
jgi:hypothetical protein